LKIRIKKSPAQGESSLWPDLLQHFKEFQLKHQARTYDTTFSPPSRPLLVEPQPPVEEALSSKKSSKSSLVDKRKSTASQPSDTKSSSEKRKLFGKKGFI
jgi:hypothetical protein